MMIVLAAAHAEPSAGWGKLSALIVAGLVFWALTAMYERWQSMRSGSSPTATATALGGVKPQVNDPLDPLDPPGGVVVPAAASAPATLDTWVAARVGREPNKRIIRAAARRFGRSESTAKRALRRVRSAQPTGGDTP